MISHQNYYHTLLEFLMIPSGQRPLSALLFDDWGFLSAWALHLHLASLLEGRL